MKVILSNQCISLTGMLERGLGYHLEHRKNGFFAKRNTKGFVPPDGHWRFIVLCAELTRNKLYITDIRVPRCEVQAALKEAGLPQRSRSSFVRCSRRQARVKRPRCVEPQNHVRLMKRELKKDITAVLELDRKSVV